MPANLIIVKRGKQNVYDLLRGWLREMPEIEIVWDRRTSEERRRRQGAVGTECRLAERRRPFDPQWNVQMPLATDLWSVYWYIATLVTRRERSSFPARRSA
jgi:hypothetical protein